MAESKQAQGNLEDSEEQVIELLASLGASVKFCSSGRMDFVPPGLEVEGVGLLGLPLTQSEAERVLGVAEQAPYGKGEDTLVDTSVRNSFQVDASKLHFRNPEWGDRLSELLEEIAEDLGLEPAIRLKLHKLILYKEGGFFAPHRDTEKAKGMFGTLVVGLPSSHEGGALVVRHQGEEKVIRFDEESSLFCLRFAAFYADCEHEVKPVTQGYRAALVYTLSLSKGKKQPGPPSLEPEVKSLVSHLPVLFDGGYEKIVIPLEHSYTKESLEEMLLKGVDRAKVAVLKEAGKRLGYDLYLAQLNRMECGYPDMDQLYYWEEVREWRRKGKDAFKKIGWDHVYEERIFLNHFVSLHGARFPCAEMELENDEEFLADFFLDEIPYTQEINESTGNEGVTMERWYRQAVLVLWPRDRFDVVLAGQPTSIAVPMLYQRFLEEAGEPEKLPLLRGFAGAVIGEWSRMESWDGEEIEEESPIEGSPSLQMAEMVGRMADGGLLRNYICQVLPRYCSGGEGEGLAEALDRLGWEDFSVELVDLCLEQVPSKTVPRLNEVFQLTMGLIRHAQKAEAKPFLRSMLLGLQETLQTWDRNRERRILFPDPGRKGMLADLFQAWAILGGLEPFACFLEYAFETPKKYDLDEVLVPSLFSAWDRGQGFAEALKGEAQNVLIRWKDFCVSQLEALTAKKPKEPVHWGRPAKMGCSCSYCKEIEAFLRDREKPVLRIKVKKEIRKHLHRQIEARRCDLHHVTERKGSPHTLVCTKNQASFHGKIRAYERRLGLLRKLWEVKGFQ